ncbi:hypothetical protein ABH904_001480 [Pseudomonas frederiksbergensis]
MSALDLKARGALSLHRRDRGKRTNQNGQHQKSTQEKCHLAHWASYVMSLQCSGYRRC